MFELAPRGIGGLSGIGKAKLLPRADWGILRQKHRFRVKGEALPIFIQDPSFLNAIFYVVPEPKLLTFGSHNLNCVVGRNQDRFRVRWV